MSLSALVAFLIPEQSVQIVQADFSKGNPHMRRPDELSSVYTNPEFAHLFLKDGRPAQALACLALVTTMQFAEGLSDEQAADIVR